MENGIRYGIFITKLRQNNSLINDSQFRYKNRRIPNFNNAEDEKLNLIASINEKISVTINFNKSNKIITFDEMSNLNWWSNFSDKR